MMDTDKKRKNNSMSEMRSYIFSGERVYCPLCKKFLLNYR